MKIVLAPDSYKGSLTSKEACEAMETGIRRVMPDAEILKVPMADGGEGTAQSLVDAMGGEFITCEVTNPLGRKTQARYGMLMNGTAVIEMAEASGLNRIIRVERNPLFTTTYGTGELIKNALDRGCRKFLLGIGGSATNDGGAGMAQALGYRLLDHTGMELHFGGGSLNNLVWIDSSKADPRIRESIFTVACDVDNPLCGSNGASVVFGPQKGADPEMVELLDYNLEHFAAIIKRDLGVDIKHVPGSGAAGGLGGGVLAFLKGRLQPGVQIVIDTVCLEEKLIDADLILTGEGCCESQTLRGKTPYGVALTGKKAGVPVIVIAGSVGPGAKKLYNYGVISIMSLLDKPLSLEEAMAEAGPLLADAAERVLRIIKFFGKDTKSLRK